MDMFPVESERVKYLGRLEVSVQMCVCVCVRARVCVCVFVSVRTVHTAMVRLQACVRGLRT